MSDDRIRINLDEAAIDRLLRGPHGPIARDIERRCLRVEAKAVDLCPVDTGRLRASISHDVDVDRKGVYGIVGSNVEYAPHVELGTSSQAAQPFLRPAIGAAS